MKLSELKPCASCGGPLRGELKSGMRVEQWFVVTSTMAVLNPRATNEVLGMHQFFQGKSLTLAENFAPGADDAVLIMGEKEPSAFDKLHLCFDCFFGKPLGMILEGVRERERRAEEKAAG